MTEALVGRAAATELLDGLAGEVAAPHLLDVEVLAALRGLALGGKLTPNVAEVARTEHFTFTIIRHDIAPLTERIWHLRHQFTSHDACYIALAEGLDIPCELPSVWTGRTSWTGRTWRTQHAWRIRRPDTPEYEHGDLV
ncbi:MAG: type II toxin-antitoxin system VapC family toxin [Micrococcales bacterium]|nr:type II toxin-antitoxin system VapC family toxin [Micrococcales bacterium]